MAEVVALGEALIDFTPAGRSEAGNPIFERNPGGAPANVLAFLSRLGVGTSFIGKVGDDLFGHVLQEVLDRAGIGTKGMILSKDYNTTLSFVDLNEKGDRSFGFIRKNGADKMLKEDEVDWSLLEGAKIFHFGGVTLTDEPSRSATLQTVQKARKQGLLVSYDPNYRPPLWKDRAEDTLREGVRLADILKVSDEECRKLSGTDDLAKGTEYLSSLGPRLVFVTLGPQGSAYRLGTCYREQETFDVKTVDTTGAGDAFLGGILFSLLQSDKKLSEVTVADADRFMRFANAAGSLVTTRKGALLSMPDLGQIQALLASHPFH